MDETRIEEKESVFVPCFIRGSLISFFRAIRVFRGSSMNIHVKR
jgi:hypothetical protein